MREFNAAKAYVIAELEKLMRLYQLSGRDYETKEVGELRLTFAGCRYTLRFEDSVPGVRERIHRLKKTQPPKVFKPPEPISLARSYSDATFADFITDGDMEGAVSYAALFGREVFYEATGAGPLPLKSVSEIQAGIIVAYSLQSESWGVLHIDSGRYLRKGCVSRAKALREYNEVLPDRMEKALAAAKQWAGFQERAREKYHDLRP